MKNYGLGERSSIKRNYGTVKEMKGLLVLAASLVVLMYSAPAWAVMYSVQGLGYLSSSEAYDINDLGQVVGTNTGSAFLWDPKQGMVELVDPSGRSLNSRAYGINDLGQVVGYAVSAGGSAEAVLWDGTQGMTWLGHLPGSIGRSGARDINNLGQVVGYSESANGYEAFIWSAETGMAVLRDFSGTPIPGIARGINEMGQVVGTGNPDLAFGSYAFLWDPVFGMTQLLPNLSMPSSSEAFSVNELGQVAGGYSIPLEGYQLFLWDPVTGVDRLKDLPGEYLPKMVRGMNDSGVVVGSITVERTEAVAWFPVYGPVSLNSLVDESGTGWSLIFAQAINNHGQIVGQGINPEGRHEAFLLSPITGPTDADRDGLLDKRDNCPYIANPDQSDCDANGFGDLCDVDAPCLDKDGDGVLNGTDNCPEIANPAQSDCDANGLGDACDPDALCLDRDADGVQNGVDNCPDFPNSGQGDCDGNGLGDACDIDSVCSPLTDKDNDGVMNGVDNCPHKWNPDQSDLDGDGLGDRCDDDMDGDNVLNIDDNCQAVANSPQTDCDGNGTGDACDMTSPCTTLVDKDQDGLVNADDNCLGVFNPDQADCDQNGIGDACDYTAPCSLDTDRDGVQDKKDNCPNQVNHYQDDLDQDGRGDACDSDADADGYEADDCDDRNRLVHPGAVEVCSNALIDEDCDGYAEICTDIPSVLANGSFEQGFTGWEASGFDLVSSSTDGSSGVHVPTDGTAMLSATVPNVQTGNPVLRQSFMSMDQAYVLLLDRNLIDPAFEPSSGADLPENVRSVLIGSHLNDSAGGIVAHGLFPSVSAANRWETDKGGYGGLVGELVPGGIYQLNIYVQPNFTFCPDIVCDPLTDPSCGSCVERHGTGTLLIDNVRLLPASEYYCSGNEDCGDPSKYCAKDPGGCEVGGVCEVKPQLNACPATYTSVQGCDGVRHDNECVAAASGVSVHYYSGMDTDGDGVPDAPDLCPNHWNPDQADLDNDGIGNACDPDTDGDGYQGVYGDNSDCNDYDAQINPGMPEVCGNNSVDENCDGVVAYEPCPECVVWTDCICRTVDGVEVCYDLSPCSGFACVDGICVLEGLPPDQDPDGDCIESAFDNCDLVYNPSQEDGDGDGIGDPCDCDADGDGPLTMEVKRDIYQTIICSGTGQDCDDSNSAIHPGMLEDCSNTLDDNCDGVICRTPDRDLDGFSDDYDNCPNDFNPFQEDADGDGVGDLCNACGTDCDQDGLLNADDPAPHLAPDGDVNRDGMVDLGDCLVAIRMASGIVAVDPVQGHMADVSPYVATGGVPDKFVDMRDMLGLFRMMGP